MKEGLGGGGGGGGGVMGGRVLGGGGRDRTERREGRGQGPVCLRRDISRAVKARLYINKAACLI